DGKSPWQSGGSISIDTKGWRGDTKEATQARLRSDYRAGPDLLEALKSLSNDEWWLSFFRFGTSTLHMAVSSQGSAHCQNFVFFDVPAAAAARVVAAPPSVQNAEPMTFCYKNAGYAGTVTGVSAFIAEDNRDDSTVALTITPWRDGRWQQACRVVITFSDVFQVIDRFCQGVDCPL